MSCAERPRLTALAEGALPWREREELLVHLERCAECQAALVALGGDVVPGPLLYLPSEALVAATVGAGSREDDATQHGLFSDCLPAELFERIAAGSEAPARGDREREHLTRCPACQADMELAVVLADETAHEYVPGPFVVNRALSGSSRLRPRFAMPEHLLGRPRPRRSRSSIEKVAGVLAAAGLTPASLAAAVVIHATLAGLAGFWVAQGSRGVAARLAATSRPVERVERVALTAPTHHPEITPPAPTTRRPPVAAVGSADSAAGAARRRYLQEREAEYAEAQANWAQIASDVNQQVLFERDYEQPVQRSREGLARVLIALERYPALRIQLIQRVEGRFAQDSLSLPWRRALELKRLFVSNGIAAERIVLVVETANEPLCPAREQYCAPGQQVKVEGELVHVRPPE